MNDLSDVLIRIRQAPLAALVDELRTLHENRAAPAAHREPAAAPRSSELAGSAPLAAAAAAPASPHPTSDALAPELELLLRATAAAAMPHATPSASLPVAPGPRVLARDEHYAMLQKHFGEHELELRGHARLTERILDQLAHGELASVPPVPAPLQQEVRVLCATGATSGARFLLRNDLGRDVRVDLRARPLRDAADLDGLQVGCEPQRVELAAGTETLVRVGIDLTRCAPVVVDGALELVIDALVDEQVVQKIWVELIVHDAHPADGGNTP